MLGGLFLLALGWWFDDRLPPPGQLRQELLAEPVQVPVDAPAFTTSAGGTDYLVRPRYSYDISGLVVSMHRADTWWDTVHLRADDFINVVDLCVVWGKNATSGIYYEMNFFNTDVACDITPKSADAQRVFKMAQLSNNHMVTEKPVLARMLGRIHVGDQVRLRGYLVDYGVIRDGVPQGMRVSSSTRTDTGDGACEIIYVTSVERLATTAGAYWRAVFYLGALALLGAGAAWAFLPITRIDENRGFWRRVIPPR